MLNVSKDVHFVSNLSRIGRKRPDIEGICDKFQHLIPYYVIVRLYGPSIDGRPARAYSTAVLGGAWGRHLLQGDGGRFWIFSIAAICVTLVIFDSESVQAETPAVSGKPSVSSPVSVPTDGKPDTAKFAVTGFRSSKFGMNEAEIRSAISKDFGVSSDVVKSSINPTEQTQLLTLRVPDLLPGGGAADVVYVLGYKSKRLIQVNVAWSKVIDPKITAERLYNNAEILRADFAEKGYKPETVASGTAVKNGVLMFRGEDADDHVTALILQGPITADKEEKKLVPNALLLFYTADAKHPDIFRLAPGQF